MTDEAKKALENAISKIGKGYGELLKVAERYGYDIEPAQYQKARVFLDRTIGKIWENIDVVRDVASATSGNFSLDQVDLPLTEHVDRPVSIHEHLRAHVAATAQPAELSDGRALARQIGGRLTKSAIARLELEQSVNTDSPRTTESSGMSDDDDVDFIDD